GVSRGVDAAELRLAGASAVQVGSATFADPRAGDRVRDELQSWAARTHRRSIAESVGAAHQRENSP
ncbi:MAG: dihydroorotate dehydrogenase, partial [Microthrixaceae bacterium]